MKQRNLVMCILPLLFFSFCSSTPSGTTGTTGTTGTQDPTSPSFVDKALTITDELNFLFTEQNVASDTPTTAAGSKIFTHFGSTLLRSFGIQSSVEASSGLLVEWSRGSSLTFFPTQLQAWPATLVNAQELVAEAEAPNFYFEKHANNKFISWFFGYNSKPIMLYLKKQIDKTYWLQVFDLESEKDLDIALLINIELQSSATMLAEVRKEFPEAKGLTSSFSFNSVDHKESWEFIQLTP